MIVVTGGAGFLGGWLVDRLIADGGRVRVVEKPGASIDHLPLDRIDLARADVRDRSAVRQALFGAKQVYHLAANPQLWARDPEEFDAINRQGTIHVLEEALAAGAERVLHVSTESILAPMRLCTPPPHWPSDEAERAVDWLGAYCLSKFRAERFAYELAKAGAPILIATPTLPIGPGDRNQSPPTRMTLACCRGRTPFYLDAEVNLIDARDAADGLARTMAVGRPLRRYLLGGWNLRIGQWLTAIAQASGRSPPRGRIPYGLALLWAILSEQWASLRGDQPPLASTAGVRLTRYSMRLDPSQTLAELGLRPRPLEESLREAVDWYRMSGWL